MSIRRKVDRVTLQLFRKGPGRVRWCMTPLTVSTTEVPELLKPVLPKGALLDRFGQSVQRNWPAKTRSIEELKTRIQKQYEDASVIKWPEQFSASGRLEKRRIRAMAWASSARTRMAGARGSVDRTATHSGPPG